jgi:hypothetical protein
MEAYLLRRRWSVSSTSASSIRRGCKSWFGQPGPIGNAIGRDGMETVAVEQLAGRIHQPFSVRRYRGMNW